MFFLKSKLSLFVDVIMLFTNMFIAVLNFLINIVLEISNIILRNVSFLLSLFITKVFFFTYKVLITSYSILVRLLFLSIFLFGKLSNFFFMSIYQAIVFIIKILYSLKNSIINLYSEVYDKFLAFFVSFYRVLFLSYKYFCKYRDLPSIAKYILKRIRMFFKHILSKLVYLVNYLLYKIYYLLLVKSKFLYTINFIFNNIKLFSLYIMSNIYKLAVLLKMLLNNIISFIKNLVIVSLIFCKTIFTSFINIFTLTFWKNFVKILLQFLVILLEFLKDSYNALLKEIIELFKYLPNILKSLVIFILIDLLKIKKVYAWSMKNLFSFTIISLSFLIVIVTILLFYNNKDNLDKFTKKWDNIIGFTLVNNLFNVILNSDIFKPVVYYNISSAISEGSTLSTILQQEGINNSDINKIISAINKKFNIRNIRPNWLLNITIARSKDWEYSRIQKISIPVSNTYDLVTEANNNYDYVSYKNPKKLTRNIIRRRVFVKDSIYQSTLGAGVPDSITAEVLQVLSWEVDFQREIRRNDRFEVVFECLYNQNDEMVTCDNVLYVLLKGSIKTTSFYKYNGSYYHDDGSTVAKTLVKTPINNARLTSTFGVRNHPILGYTLLHKGVDFAAPVGTPIYASGNGIIETIQYSNTYGNFIRIKHNEHLMSLYAHMIRFAPGLKRGDKVKQWQVIGYLGGTGRVTGPHLHYEVLINGKQINPLTIKMPSERKLTDQELTNFEMQKVNFDNLLIKLPLKGKVVSPISEDNKDAGIINV